MIRRFFPSTFFGGMVLDPDYQAVIDYAILQGYTLPSMSVQARDNSRVINLKTEGVWTELDVLYIFEQSAGCSDFARINFKDPSNFYLTAAPTYSIPTFEANLGFKGGTSLGFNTNWNASVDAVNFLNNDSCFIFKGYDSLETGIQTFAHARTANNTSQISLAFNTTTFLHRIATTAGGVGSTFANTDNHQLWNRGSNFREIYENGVQNYTNSGINGPAAFSNLDLYLFCSNENGTTLTSCNQGFSYFGWGSDLSAKASEIYNIMNGTY